MKYKSHLNATDTPSRKVRKSSRLETFIHNNKAKKKQKKARREARVAQ